MKITDDALEAAVKLSARYITDRYLPDKAIDLIDEAASKVRLKAFTAPVDLKKLESRLRNWQRKRKMLSGCRSLKRQLLSGTRSRS